MKDDILTAVKEDPIPTNVAPIAPLPSRLSFCFSPKQSNPLAALRQEAYYTSNIQEESTTCTNASPAKTTKSIINEIYVGQNQIVSEEGPPAVSKRDSFSTSPDKKFSPTKLQNLIHEGSSACSGVALSTLAAVKRSPTVAPSMAGRMVAKGNAIEIDSIDSEIMAHVVHDNISTIKMLGL